MNLDELTFDVSQEIEIKAAPGTVYQQHDRATVADHGRR